MRINRRGFAAGALVLATTATAPAVLRAQEFPNKPVRVLVPYG